MKTQKQVWGRVVLLNKVGEGVVEDGERMLELVGREVLLEDGE